MSIGRRNGRYRCRQPPTVAGPKPPASTFTRSGDRPAATVARRSAGLVSPPFMSNRCRQPLGIGATGAGRLSYRRPSIYWTGEGDLYWELGACGARRRRIGARWSRSRLSGAHGGSRSEIGAVCRSARPNTPDRRRPAHSPPPPSSTRKRVPVMPNAAEPSAAMPPCRLLARS